MKSVHNRVGFNIFTKILKISAIILCFCTLSNAYSDSKNIVSDGMYLSTISEWEEIMIILKSPSYHWELISPEEGTLVKCKGLFKIENQRFLKSNRECAFVRNDPNNPPPYIPEKKEDENLELRNVNENSFELFLNLEDNEGWFTFKRDTRYKN